MSGADTNPAMGSDDTPDALRAQSGIANGGNRAKLIAVMGAACERARAQERERIGRVIADRAEIHKRSVEHARDNVQRNDGTSRWFECRDIAAGLLREPYPDQSLPEQTSQPMEDQAKRRPSSQEPHEG